MTMNRKTFAVTVGDPNGIGPEITVRMLAALSAEQRHNIIVVGSRLTLQTWFDRLEIPFPGWCSPGDTKDIRVKSVDVPVSGGAEPGQVTAAGGATAIETIETAHKLCINKICQGIVTGPIGKEAIRLAGSEFSGHTDMLCALTHVPETRMAMILDNFRVVMTTLHISYRKVLEMLTTARIEETLRLAHHAFKTSKRPFPKIAVGGLNPHAGEHGLFGCEETDIIIPAIENFRKVNPNIDGPFPCDSMYKKSMREKFDVFVAHTHDQGLIAIKTLDDMKCVNVTLGLPYIRTSVGHGTAYDIAGSGKADPAGLLEALRVAHNLSE